jgi:hypothetical protein
MARCAPSGSRRGILCLTAVALTVGLAGCFTGARPHLADAPAETGDAAVDAVLDRLEHSRTAVFTADYDVLTRFGGLQTPATVVQAAADRRSITVGDVRFLYDGATTATCLLDTAACSGTIDAGQISDTQLAPDFYGTSAAARLRRDAGARVDATTASSEVIAGEPATCVAIPVPSSTSTYCALDSGVLARLDAADVVIDMTAYSAQPDEAQFARSSS